MKNSLVNSLLAVCHVLNKHSVQYLVVGGTAVALHGYFRQSVDLAGAPTAKPDLDFWYNPTYGNYFNLLDALAELGQDVAAYKKEQTPNPGASFFRYELEHFTLDLLPALKSALKFTSSHTNRETVAFNDVDIPFICYEDLLVDKQNNARPKDIIDIEQLKQQRNATT